MIKYIKVMNHKALKQAQLEELGHINIICGKNNSGKTTLLEALFNTKNHGIGIKVDIDWLVELFNPLADHYKTPHPEGSKRWFKEYITNLVHQNEIWFSSDRPKIINELRQAQNNDQFLRRFDGNTYDFESLINAFLSKAETFYNPVLIPPKRQLEFESPIHLNQDINTIGSGIINKLFYLKNQDLESDDYRIYKLIYDTFFEITGSRFNVVPNRDNQIRLYYFTGNKWIPASDCGLGLSDVLIIISNVILMDSNVFLIEEPENHLHAEYQKRLLKYLHSLKEKQFFITTHFSIFLDTTIVDKIFYCKNEGEILLSDQTSKSKIINALGYSITENLVADLIILVEGPTDVPVIREMLNWLGVNSNHNIKFWALGGDIMSSLDLSVFAERSNVFALVDSDPGSQKQRTRFLRNCAEIGINCKKLEKYSIENYFTLEAIREAFPDQIPNELVELLPKKKVDAQIGFTEKQKTIKIKNAEIVKHMSISDITGTDLHQFLLDIQSFLMR